MTFDSAELKTLVTNKLKPQLWYSLKDQDYLPRRVLHRALGVDANELDTVVSCFDFDFYSVETDRYLASRPVR